MGLFGMISDIIDTPNKSLGKSIEKKIRGDMEDLADSIDPNLGKVVRGFNNLRDTLDNAQDSMENEPNRRIQAFFDKDSENLSLADHIYIQKLGYTHHGLYVGNNKVIHYIDGEVQRTSLESFANGTKIFKKSEYDSPINYSTEEVISRAQSRLYEDNYNLFINNCESFVRWCRAGGNRYSTI